MPIKHTTGKKVEDEIKSSDKSVHIIKFSADYCNPCKMASTMIKDLEDKGKLSDVVVYEIDVEHDDSIDYATRKGVRGVPFFVKMDKDCNILDQKVGMGGPDAFLELCKV